MINKSKLRVYECYTILKTFLRFERFQKKKNELKGKKFNTDINVTILIKEQMNNL